MTQTFPHGAIEISHPTKGTFKVNGHQLKPYAIREDPSLFTTSAVLAFMNLLKQVEQVHQATDVKQVFLGRQSKVT